MKKRFLGIVLCIIMLVGIVPYSTYAQSGEKHVVIVVDTADKLDFLSGGVTIIYTADSAIDYVKQASGTFIDNVLSSNSGINIAVVQYNTNASVVCDFSKDKEQIKSSINSLHVGDANSNISDGLKKADQLLDNVNDPYADKNIVIVTTGFTNCGENTYNGYYTASSPGSEWYNMGTGEKLYSYASVAYQTAADIKQDTTIYSLGVFQTMEDMPQEGKEIAEFFRITARDLASDPNKFFEITDPRDIGLYFEDVAKQIKDVAPTPAPAPQVTPEPVEPAQQQSSGIPWLWIIIGIVVLLLLLLLLLICLSSRSKNKSYQGFNDTLSRPKETTKSEPIKPEGTAKSFSDKSFL